MIDLSDLSGRDGIDDAGRPLLQDMLASVLRGEAARHGNAYADLVITLLIAYDLRKHCQAAQTMIGERDRTWFAGCRRGLTQLLQRYIETCGMSDAEIESALALADRLWCALQTPDTFANCSKPGYPPACV